MPKINFRRVPQQFAVAASLFCPLFPSARAQVAPPAAGPVEETSVLTAAAARPKAAGRTPRETPEMIAAALKDIPAVPAGPFQESWQSIQENYKDPDWFRDGKFGIMMHWGIYSVPAHASEWYVRYMYGGQIRAAVWSPEADYRARATRPRIFVSRLTATRFMRR